MNGHIRLHRSITEWEWYKNINTKVVFLHCLLKANWKDGRFEGKEVPRGSFVTSLKHLSLELGLSQQAIRTALDHLIETGEINKQTTNRFSLISVVNYDIYQIEQQTDNKQITNEQQTNNNNRRKKEYIFIDSKESICQKQVSDDFRRAVTAWNELDNMGIKPVSRVSMDSKRGKMLNARIKEYGIDEVLKAIKKVGESDYLRGMVKPVSWFNFDWFVKPNNFPKVLEGNYDITVNNDDLEDW